MGAGGHGKVVADAALCSGWDSIIFYDDNWPKKAELGHGAFKVMRIYFCHKPSNLLE
ncbi:hypothetical protein [Legionella anisa]|uniref:PglD-related sugar-binding protein n=1 Tax=Legionella anisa TaxID=28082 RepID=UPI003CC61558